MMIQIKNSRLSRSAFVAAVSLALAATACSRQSAQVEPVEDAAQAPVAEQSVAPETTAPLPGADAMVKFGPALPQDLQGSPAQSGGECGIEATAAVPQGGELALSRSRPELIQGWAIYREDKTKPSNVYLKLASGGDASYFAPVTMESRAGLGIRLGDETLDNAAFKATLDLGDVPAGEYTVQVAQRVGEKILLCATGRSAKVSD
jgi:hypothetical protein